MTLFALLGMLCYVAVANNIAKSQQGNDMDSKHDLAMEIDELTMQQTQLIHQSFEKLAKELNERKSELLQAVQDFKQTAKQQIFDSIESCDTKSHDMHDQQDVLPKAQIMVILTDIWNMTILTIPIPLLIIVISVICSCINVCAQKNKTHYLEQFPSEFRFNLRSTSYSGLSFPTNGNLERYQGYTNSIWKVKHDGSPSVCTFGDEVNGKEYDIFAMTIAWINCKNSFVMGFCNRHRFSPKREHIGKQNGCIGIHVFKGKRKFMVYQDSTRYSNNNNQTTSENTLEQYSASSGFTGRDKFKLSFNFSTKKINVYHNGYFAGSVSCHYTTIQAAFSFYSEGEGIAVAGWNMCN